MQLGAEVTALLSKLRIDCLPCRIGWALDLVAKANNLPRHDWAGVEARRFGHICKWTTWNLTETQTWPTPQTSPTTRTRS